MVILPIGFTPTKYPGYFWNVPEQALYSIKVSGVLTRLKKYNWIYKNYPISREHLPHYRVSVKGKRKILTVEELCKLNIADSVIPLTN